MVDSTKSKRLTRQELAQFLPTDRAIRAFEGAFDDLTQTIPNNTEEAISTAESAQLDAGVIYAKLNQLQTEIEELKSIMPMDYGGQINSILAQLQKSGVDVNIRYFNANIGEGTTFANVTITPAVANISKSQLIMQGAAVNQVTTNLRPDDISYYIEFTNASTVKVQRGGNLGVMNARFAILEYL